MEKNETNAMLVSWGPQQRLIIVKVDDTIKNIKKAIRTVYQLKGNVFKHYQIQYYDNIYEQFIDLSFDRLEAFQNILKKLSSSEAPPKSTNDWILRIVKKSIPNQQRKAVKLATDDTYGFQQEDDLTESPVIEKPSPFPISRPTTLDIAGSGTTIEGSPPENTETNEATTVKPNAQSCSVHFTTQTSSDHPYDLKFEGVIASRQRLQYDKDMNRTSGSKKSKVGGVLLRACPTDEQSTNRLACYPIVCFQIPKEVRHLNWCILFYILTQADQNGVYYVHTSKGIFPGDANLEKYCLAMRNSVSVNPYAVRLTDQQIENGRLEVRIKVSSLTDVSSRKGETLKIFSSSTDCKTFNDLTSQSVNTIRGLNLSSENYHLGCALICDDMIHDRCVSNMTMAVSSAKRSNGGNSQKSQPRESRNKKLKTK